MHPLDGRGHTLDRRAHGNSYMQVVAFGDDGPQADTLLAPSEPDDPGSPHHGDATRDYVRKEWNRFPFSERAMFRRPA
ncbi:MULTISPECIES: penicillin acylase family protein [unclassified Caballeronia]|uniref:penicillin acylase family protein n=1 Tax=unclassified Caballeronia TaxID=2646786 RepID=UPI0038574B0D